MKPLAPALGTLAVAVAALALNAAAQRTAAQTAAHAPDPRHGFAIVENGTDAGAPPCQTCHGVQGDGTGASPRLFGQSREYLTKQLHDFKTGTARQSDVMTPVAELLSDDDIADVAAYYATRGEVLPPPTRASAAMIARGRTLATIGDQAKTAPACNNCHGPGGVGQPPAIPALAGQFAPYIAAQLKLWRDGKRTSSAAQMEMVVKHLNDSDIEAVAAYYAQIRDTTAGNAPPRRPGAQGR